jgi:glutamate synthase domain-containing protein 3
MVMTAPSAPLHLPALEHGACGGAGPVAVPDGAGVLAAIPWGSTGKSFGAFPRPGEQLGLAGEAADYLGQGMRGGRIVVRPAPRARTIPSSRELPPKEGPAHPHDLIAAHAGLTGSRPAAALLQQWAHAARRVRQVTPLAASAAASRDLDSLDAGDPVAVSA